MPTMTNELYAAAERSLYAAGLKAKDTNAVLTRLEKEYNITPSVEGNMLTLKQGDTLFSVGTVLETYKNKYPMDFHGGIGQINFKSDLGNDLVAKSNFIKAHGFDKWNALPATEKSPGAQHTVTNELPNAGMTRAQYSRLSLAEKSTLAGQIGARGIESILRRK